MINLIFDTDMLCFQAASSCEHEIGWGNDLWTFKRWVTSKVLPAIRKTGKYEAPKDEFV